MPHHSCDSVSQSILLSKNLILILNQSNFLCFRLHRINMVDGGKVWVKKYIEGNPQTIAIIDCILKGIRCIMELIQPHTDWHILPSNKFKPPTIGYLHGCLGFDSFCFMWCLLCAYCVVHFLTILLDMIKPAFLYNGRYFFDYVYKLIIFIYACITI